MKIQFTGLIKSTIPSILAFTLIDSIVEFVILKISGISLLSYFEQFLHRKYEIQFYSFNFLIFSWEMLLAMFLYAHIRLLFGSKTKPIVISTFFFISFTGLFLIQLVNLGIYPLKPALIFGISTLFGFPVAIFIGATVYEKTIE